MKHGPLINAYICVVLILIVCLLPGSSFPSVTVNWISFDKLVHVIMYLALSWTLSFGFKRQNTLTRIQSRFLLWTFIISCVYGALIELLQFALTPDRACELYDFFADALGAGLGLMTFKLGERLILFWNRLFKCFS